MACVEPNAQLDDQSFALQLQLEELEAQREQEFGQWTADNRSDFAWAIDEFEAQLKNEISLHQDSSLAHSIAKAVDADAEVINEHRGEETQSARDRNFAVSLNEGEDIPMPDAVNDPIPAPSEAESAQWEYILQAADASIRNDESGNAIAGPLTRYAARQNAVLEQIAQLEVDCDVCQISVQRNTSVRLRCEDVYCKPCLKRFLMDVAKKKGPFPPKCHGQTIDILALEADFTPEELAIYQRAELEFASINKVYCANADCAVFILEAQRNPDIASCDMCGNGTCIHCKALAHAGGCPEDENRQRIIELGQQQGWKDCLGCGQMVFRYEGCDHMTCLCGTEFCYRCGAKWKTCPCDDWVPEILHQRAQQVVDREAVQPVAPVIRQQQVAAMERELRQNHECNHSGRFYRVDLNEEDGEDCEICGSTLWQYILRCKRCHMQACEDCRQHRL